MHDRLQAAPSEVHDLAHDASLPGDDDRQAKFYAASLAAIARFSEQLDREDRLVEKKDERAQALEREIVALRTTIASLQRANDDARSAYDAAQSDRQRTVDRFTAEIIELRLVRDDLRASDLARGKLLGKLAEMRTEYARDFQAVRADTEYARDREAMRADAEAALATERERVVALSRETTERAQRLDAVELERTRAQIAEVDALIGQIHRSFFWKIKLALGTVRSPLRSLVRTAVRR